MTMWVVSVVSLSIVMLLCLAGTFSCKYDDNLFQRMGMAGLFLGCIPRLDEAWHSEYVTPGVWIAHLGLAAFALGTAWKVLKFNLHKEPEELPEIQTEHLRHVTGGAKE